MIRGDFVFGETMDNKCYACGARTVLVAFCGEARVDEEPFKSFEKKEDSPEHKRGMHIPDAVQIGDELTGHYCLTCGVLTSIAFNAVPRA